MELLQLKYFITVARHEHMTRAAEQLHISQPALSRTIAALEQSVGVQLFERTSKYIKLNAHGRSFLKNVEQALTILDNAERELRDLEGEPAEPISLTFTVASYVIPALLSAFRKKHPRITFRLRQNVPSFGQQDFDLLITTLPYPSSSETATVPLLTEDIFLAIPRDHPLAKRTSIRLEEAAGEEFISLRRGSNLRELTEHLCGLAGFAPNIVFESDNPSIVRGLIGEGQGVALFPAVTWGGSIGRSSVLLPIEEPVCKRTIGVVWNTSRYVSRSTELFKEFAVRYFNNFTSELR